MKLSKPIDSSARSNRKPLSPDPRADAGLDELRALQRDVAQALFRPLAPGDRIQSRWTDGRPMRQVAAEWIKPHDRLTSLDRLQIYNRCYWYRVLDCLYDDFPGVQAVLGARAFLRLITAYLTAYPSISYTLRDLGSRMERFLRSQPQWAGARLPLALDMIRFEWAQITAFDDPALPPVPMDDLLGASPATLRLGLQPYVALLDLAHPVDEFALAIKTADSDGQREQVSNVSDSAPKAGSRRRVRLPKPETTFVAVHRMHNSIYIKRLEREQFLLLRAVRDGATLEDAVEQVLAGGDGATLSAKVGAWFQNAASLGWFCAPRAASAAALS